MALEPLALRFPVGDLVWLRELTGHDEEAVSGNGTATALELLDRLRVAGPRGGAEPGGTAQLTAADRDRVLAAVYVRTYGPRIAGTSRCGRCHALFDLEFSLPELVDSIDGERPALAMKPTHALTLPDGRRFRLPTGADELDVALLPPDQAERALLERCVLEGDPAVDAGIVEEAMAAAAPLLSLDLAADCPECDEPQHVRFDVQDYLLGALARDRDRLVREVHLLAVAHGWHLDEILGLTRGRRRAYVALIEAELQMRRRRVS